MNDSPDVDVLTGQRHREVAKAWSSRKMCNKPQEPKVESPPSTVAEHCTLIFRLWATKDAQQLMIYYFPACACLTFCFVHLFVWMCPRRTAARASFKVPGYRPSEMDRKMLLWSGRYKTADQIPEFVSWVATSCLYQNSQDTPPPLIDPYCILVRIHQRNGSKESQEADVLRWQPFRRDVCFLSQDHTWSVARSKGVMVSHAQCREQNTHLELTESSKAWCEIITLWLMLI